MTESIPAPLTDRPPVPVVLDTDTAQDDCVTILAALRDPACDLLAITMVAGNVGFDRQVHNAHLTLNAAGALGAVPVHLGCDQPMTRQWHSAEEVHGDGVGGLELDVEGVVNADEHGVEALLRLTRERPGEIAVVAIGPLTNIATACVLDRSFPSRVKSLYVMGGSNNGRGNVTPSAEYNFYVDPEAAQVVMDAGFDDLTIVTWDPVTLRDLTYPRARYDELCSLGTDVSAFFKQVCDTTLDFNESVGVDGSTHPDSFTLAALLHPELVLSSGRYRVDVETRSDLTRGFSAMAWDKYPLTPNASVVEEADSEGFYTYLRQILSAPTAPTAHRD